ncbi:MAG: hypothetical protein JST93_19430 [Acidobacteria bacterium]|nr:hypothetical protein [Acidobacteriota bacterium]
MLALLFFIAISASAQDSLSGKWQIQRSAAGRESTQQCTLSQKENALTGECSTDRGAIRISGKVDGKNVTWTYKSDSEGGAVTVVYNGAIESASKITGTVLAVEFSVEGDFTATRIK